jgi:hypothetical protein
MRASIPRFAPCNRDELIPGHIGNAFRQTVVFLHIRDVQILKHDRPEPVHQLPGGLMSKIEPPVGDSFVNVRDDRPSFFPVGSAFLCF